MRPCLDCGRPTSGSRCPAHQRDYERRRGTPAERGYDKAWRALVANAISLTPWCCECGSTDDLTGDHIVPLSKGGRSVASNVRVLCRSCNSSKGGRGRVGTVAHDVWKPRARTTFESFVG